MVWYSPHPLPAIYIAQWTTSAADIKMEAGSGAGYVRLCAPTHTTISTILWGNSVCRYWEAISHWDMALELTPECAELHEMKAQVSVHLCGWAVLVGLSPLSSSSPLIHHDSVTLTSDHHHPIILKSDLPSAHKFRHFINLHVSSSFHPLCATWECQAMLVNVHYCLLSVTAYWCT